MEFRDNLDFSHDVLIELFKLFRGNPIFKMQRAAHFLCGELQKIAARYCEASHIPLAKQNS